MVQASLASAVPAVFHFASGGSVTVGSVTCEWLPNGGMRLKNYKGQLHSSFGPAIVLADNTRFWLHDGVLWAYSSKLGHFEYRESPESDWISSDPPKPVKPRVPAYWQ